MQPNPIFDALVQTAGSRRALATELGVTEQAVGQWYKRGWMPASRAQQVATIYNLDWTSLAKPELRELIAAAR